MLLFDIILKNYIETVQRVTKGDVSNGKKTAEDLL